MGIPDHLTCLLRNAYAGQETIRTRHGAMDWFKIGKAVHQACILSQGLFNLYVEYITRNAGLDEAQAGIEIAGRNTNNFRYADDITLMAESEELNSLLMKVKVKLLSCVRLLATPPGSSVHGIFQARVPEWVAISLLQEIFPTQGLNLGLMHCRQMLYHLSHQGRCPDLELVCCSMSSSNCCLLTCIQISQKASQVV